MRPSYTIGAAVSRPLELEPVPASAVQAVLMAPDSARWPGELFAWPPGCVQFSLMRGAGSTTGLSAAANSAPPTLSCAGITAMRVPGRGSCFLANGLRSLILGRLGRLSEQPPTLNERTSPENRYRNRLQELLPIRAPHSRQRDFVLTAPPAPPVAEPPRWPSLAGGPAPPPSAAATKPITIPARSRIDPGVFASATSSI